MLLEEVPFHNTEILEVREHTFDQTIDFLLNFPINRENNKIEKRILRFINVAVYVKKEIPFRGYPDILDIKLRNANKHTWLNASGNVETSIYKAEMITNAGSRFIEFSNVELLNYVS